jgi:phage terminase large subunit GpA-like protein
MMSPRADDTTNISIAFANGMDIIGAWAGSASAVSSDAMEIVIIDEMNKISPATGSEPDFFHLARARTNSFPYTYKIYGSSTPNDESGLLSHVIRDRSDEIRYYYARCPICGEEQRMLWENISWGKCRDPREILRRKLARYYCSACGMAWDDSMRDQAVLATMKTGWRPAKPDADAPPLARPRTIAFKLQSWYVQSMSEAAASFVEGQEERDKLKVWVTQHAAEEWKETIVPKKESAVLAHRIDIPPLIVPREAVALTAGIDHQKRGFWFVVRAWGEDLTSWLIQYGYLMSWADVETLIWRTSYRVEGSQNTMEIWRAAIDTGGGADESEGTTMPEETYQWLRRQPPVAFGNNGAPILRIFGIKGASTVGSWNGKRIRESRIDSMPYSQKPIPGGLELRLLDTEQFKGLIHWRLDRKESDSQQFFLHADTGEDYARQLLSEEYGPDPKHRGKKCWRVRRGYLANHLLDAEVMAAACADPQWQPSLQMLAGFLKRQAAEKAPPRKPEEPSTEETPTIYKLHKRNEDFERPGWLSR